MSIKHTDWGSMSANERQIGGGHYKSNYQHWDWVLKTGMGYLEACATKYVSRWRRKDGVEGLRKAEHYVQKLMENHAQVRANRPAKRSEDFNRQEAIEFATVNSLNYREARVCELLATWEVLEDIREARHCLQELIFHAAMPSPRTDSNKHAVEEDPNAFETRRD